MMKIGLSFRVLANLEYAFVSHLNWKYGKLFEFNKIRTTDFAFEYGMSEVDYNRELNLFLENHLSSVRPVHGAPGAICSLLRQFPEICIITDLDQMHQRRLVEWVAEHYDAWQPTLFHSDSMTGTNRHKHWFEKDDFCCINNIEVFVTENPVDAQRAATHILEMEVLMLDQPWNVDKHPMHTQELGSWEEILTEIHIIANDG